jgi:cytochrome bd-type quinol oxidase subunit 1
VGLSLAVFVSLYTVLGVLDFILMRRYARLDPPAAGRSGDEEAAPEPAPAY